MGGRGYVSGWGCVRAWRDGREDGGGEGGGGAAQPRSASGSTGQGQLQG
jgi:hypothetical protein